MWRNYKFSWNSCDAVESATCMETWCGNMTVYCVWFMLTFYSSILPFCFSTTCSRISWRERVWRNRVFSRVARYLGWWIILTFEPECLGESGAQQWGCLGPIRWWCLCVTQCKSREILMFVCLQKDAKQCCEAKKLDCTHCAGHEARLYSLCWSRS